MIAYVTKWWATQGIIEVKGELEEDGAYFSFRTDQGWSVVRWARSAFADREHAVAAVKKLAAKKAKQLEVQLAKLRSIAEEGL